MLRNVLEHTLPQLVADSIDGLHVEDVRSSAKADQDMVPMCGVPQLHLKQQQLGCWGAHIPSYMGLAATMWAPIGDPIPVLPPTDHPNPSQGDKRASEKMEVSKIFRCYYTAPKNSNFEAFGGPMAQVTWAQQPLRGC